MTQTQEPLTDDELETLQEPGTLSDDGLWRLLPAARVDLALAELRRHRAAAAPKEDADMVLIEETTDAIPLNEDWVTRACLEMGSPDVVSDMKLTRSVIEAYLRCRRDSALVTPTEDMRERARVWRHRLITDHEDERANLSVNEWRAMYEELLAREFTSIRREALEDAKKANPRELGNVNTQSG